MSLSRLEKPRTCGRARFWHEQPDSDYRRSRIRRFAPGDIDEVLRRAKGADVVIKHSGIGVNDQFLEARVLKLQPDAVVIIRDLDAPATVQRLHTRTGDSFRALIPRYDAIFTYDGGPGITR